MPKSTVIFEIREEDAQIVAEDNIGRRLTETEMQIVRDELDLDWSLAIENILSVNNIE